MVARIIISASEKATVFQESTVVFRGQSETSDSTNFNHRGGELALAGDTEQEDNPIMIIAPTHSV